MSSITTDQGIVHYEVYGQGRPVILLHGWLGSWGLWQETMAYMGRYYRTYALDFWGFGESGKKRNTYDVQDFVSLVDQFMEQLGIKPGASGWAQHGRNGQPVCCNTISLTGSKSCCRWLSYRWIFFEFPLKMFGRQPVAYVVYNNMWGFQLFYHLLAPLYSKDKRWPEMMDRDISKMTLESFLYSIASLRKTDLRPRLNEVKIPVMGMYGDRDVVVHPGQWKAMLAGIPHAVIERYHDAGHFIMLDEPQKFTETLRDFLNHGPTN